MNTQQPLRHTQLGLAPISLAGGDRSRKRARLGPRRTLTKRQKRPGEQNAGMA